MPTEILTLTGTQIGTHTGFSGVGNGPARIVTVNGVQALGAEADLYTLTVTQTAEGATFLDNGQLLELRDPSGTVIFSGVGVNNDGEQGLQAGDEHLILSNGYVIDINGLPIGPATIQYDITSEIGDLAVGNNNGELNFGDFPCFVPGTAIRTMSGERDVAGLVPGDLLIDADGGAPVRVLWVGRSKVDLSCPEAAGHAPVLLRAGAIRGNGGRDLVVSPDHRMQVSGNLVQVLFGCDSVLVPAKALTNLPGVRQMPGKKHVEYVSVLTERHAVIVANGQRAETLYPGPEAMSRLDEIGRLGVRAVLPQLATGPIGQVYPPAARLLSVRQGRQLVSAMQLLRSARADDTPVAQQPKAG